MNEPLPDSSVDAAARRRQFIVMMAALFASYLAMMLPMSSIPVYVAKDLGLSNFLSGLAAGASFYGTLFFRKYGGALADRLGGKHGYARGVTLYIIGGALCVPAALPILPVPMRFFLLFLGRLVLGVGESMVNVGMVSWGVACMGMQRSGWVMANIGMCMYAAVAVGGQIGFGLYERVGFAPLMAFCAALPLVSLALIRPFAPLTTRRDGGGEARISLFGVLRRIWRYGVPVMLQGVGFAILGAFMSKTFLQRGWPYEGMGLSCFGVGYVVMRIGIGHLPDRIGGIRVALFSFVLEAAGMYAIWLAPDPYWALGGAFLVGMGCSMIFPSLGMEVMRGMPAAMRGVSLGVFTIFQDVTYALAGGTVGLLVDRFGFGVAYLFGALAASCGLLIVVGMHCGVVRKDVASE